MTEFLPKFGRTVIYCQAEHLAKLIVPTSAIAELWPISSVNTNVENSFPEGFFHAREYGNGRSHSRESRAPGNEAYSHCIVLTVHAIQARHLLPAAGAA